MFLPIFIADVLFKATLHLLFVILVDRVLHRTSSAVRHRIWGITFFALLLLPAMSATIPQWRLAILPASWTTTFSQGDLGLIGNKKTDLESVNPNANLALRSSNEIHPGMDASLESSSKTDERASLLTERVGHAPVEEGVNPIQANIALGNIESPTKNHELQVAWSSWSWLAFVWCIGSMIAFGPLVVGVYRNSILKFVSKRVTDVNSTTLVSQLCCLLNIRRKVHLIECEQALIPMTWGVVKPTVILPGAWREWMKECQRLVLLHELAHVKRLDVLYQLIARFTCALYWFHPLIWYALRRLRIEREIACDDCVLMVGERPSSYAQQLLNIARDYHSMAFPPAVAMAQRAGLEYRVRALLDKARSHLPVTPRAGQALLAGGLLLSLALAAIRLEATSENVEVSTSGDITTIDVSSEKLLYEGKVVDANRVPVEGAKLFLIRFELINFSEPKLSPVAITDAKGQFKFEANAKDLATNGDPDWIASDLFAAKEGWGIAGAPSLIFESTGIAAQLVKDDQGMLRRWSTRPERNCPSQEGWVASFRNAR